MEMQLRMAASPLSPMCRTLENRAKLEQGFASHIFRLRLRSCSKTF